MKRLVTLVSDSGTRHSVDGVYLSQYFHYFDVSPGTKEIVKEFNTSFTDECLSRLEDAVVCGTYPPLEEEDKVLLDFLQPKDEVSTYLCYTIEDGDPVLQCFEPFGPVEEPPYHVFLRGLSAPYLHYLQLRGWDNLVHISAVEKNLEDLWNQCMVRHVTGGMPAVEEYLLSIPLCRVWYGELPSSELYPAIVDLVRDCAMKLIVDPNTPKDELYLLVASLTDVVEKAERFTLPWRAQLGEGDHRIVTVRAHAVGRLPLKQDIPLPYDPEWKEWD